MLSFDYFYLIILKQTCSSGVLSTSSSSTAACVGNCEANIEFVKDGTTCVTCDNTTDGYGTNCATCDASNCLVLINFI